MSRMSAGTLTPEASRTMSPGTRSALSISCSLPSRTTRAFGTTSFFSARTLSSARYSWKKPIAAFRTTTVRMTPESTYLLEQGRHHGGDEEDVDQAGW